MIWSQDINQCLHIMLAMTYKALYDLGPGYLINHISQNNAPWVLKLSKEHFSLDPVTFIFETNAGIDVIGVCPQVMEFPPP